MKTIKLDNFDNLVASFQNNDGLHNAVVNIQIAIEIQQKYGFIVQPNIYKIGDTSPYILGVYCGINVYVDPLKIWDDNTITFVNNIEEYNGI